MFFKNIVFLKQEAEIDRMSDMHDQLQRKIEECEMLKKELTVAKFTGRKMSLMPDLDGTPTFLTPTQPAPKVSRMQGLPEQRH